ncbi:integrin alpha-M-like isoform X3 [Brachyhypopomus gauderio]|uniref:integrin alpha-M-like isoform X3 n=1 Tax=Brachyhypopomus gauderio TaxID=698409 RepID=UPI0040417557
MAASHSDGFNIDVTKPEVFVGTGEDVFGYRVLQYQSDLKKQVIVSAPLRGDQRQSGAVYTCLHETKECNLLYQQDSNDTKFFGMSLAVKTMPPAGLISCSPSVTHECDGNSYLNSICYEFNSTLDTVSNSRVAFQECKKGVMNLVFLFDGSSSMTSEDFKANKEFISDVMTNHKNSSIQFAAAQFSLFTRTVFTFKDYEDGTAKKNLHDEEHMKDITNTHHAIDHALQYLFNNVTSGANPEATKALVIITDGSPSDADWGKYYKIIEKCEDQRIQRYIIGVGELNKDQFAKLVTLASEPKKENTFKIENYKGLKGLLFNLQNKIYIIEGEQRGVSRSWSKELSQSGFSAAYHEDLLVLGAVGSNNWRGILYGVMGSGAATREIEITDPELNEDSYLGYSLAVGQRGGVSLLFSGAPRANHRGQVTLFSKQNDTWAVKTRVTGEQIGSYFGSSLCLIDVDWNGDSEFLVVGAPLYYQAQPRREGRVNIYSITQQLQLVMVLEVCECVQGRFGASVAPIADLNGDELQDLAVGAPLEDEGRGAVYIYLGNHTHGIRPQYSQRIAARSISEQLQQFGVAIDGVMDMGEDGLTDIAVGARGAVVLLKARPVLSVSAKLSFSPSEISLNNFDCLLTTETTFPIITLITCFSMDESTNSTGAENPSLNVSFKITADAVKHESRAFFEQPIKTSRNLLQSILLVSQDSCFNNTVYMTNCVKDTLSPLLIRMNFSQAEEQPGNSSAVLNMDSRTMAYVEVPFQRNCHDKVKCEADLELDFKFMNSSLLVVDQAYFIITVSLLNKGDDSFNTSIVLHFPPGLSLSKFETIKASRRTLLWSCGDRDDGALNKTTCSISRPVYRSKTNATFQGIFHISQHYDWSDTMEMTLVASSDNNANISFGTVRKTLPVQYAVDMSVSFVPELSEIYLHFSLEDRGPKPLIIIYRVKNLGQKDVPVSLSFLMQISHNFTIHNHTITVSQNMKDCSITVEPPSNCPVLMRCVRFQCPVFSLDPERDVEFKLRADLTFPNLQQYTGRWSFHELRVEDVFSTFAQMDFDKTRYVQTSSGPADYPTKDLRAEINVRAELVVPPDMIMIYSCGVGGGLLLLIITTVLLLKCGFFKHTGTYTIYKGDGPQGCGEDESGSSVIQAGLEVGHDGNKDVCN